MDDTEWKVVTKDDKKRVMRRRRGRKATRASTGHPVVHSSWGSNSSALGDKDALLASLKKCQCLIVETKLFENLSKALQQQQVQQDKKIQQIVCYGMGNFSHTSLSYYSPSLWQLACVLCLRDTLLELHSDDNDDDNHLFFYDPCSTLLEKQILTQHLRVKVLTVNEHGNRPIHGIPALFFMPHCPSTLYENVLWANWGEKTPLIMVGNSLHNHCDASSVSLQAPDCPCMKALLPWLVEERMDTWERRSKAVQLLPGNFEGAFNDTYVSYVAKRLDNHWPERPYESLREVPADEDDTTASS